MTTIPAVLTALTSIARTALTGWQIINGPVDSVTTTGPRLVLIGDDLITGRRDLDSMSLDSTSETYVVPVVVNVDLVGADQGAADSLALTAYELLEASIRAAGPDVGVAGVVQAIPQDDFSLRRRSDSDGRHAAVNFSVLVLAQNT